MNGKKNPSAGLPVVEDLFELDWLLLFQRVFEFLWTMVLELYRGICYGTMPFLPCFFAGAASWLAVRYHWEYLLLERLGLAWLYPTFLWNSPVYRIAMLLSGVVGWAFYRAILVVGARNRARQVFESAGLKSRTGQLPKLIAHQEMRDGTQRMRISRSGISKQEFEKAKGSMESSMGVYFNSIEEDRVRGTLDITYSSTPIPDTVICRG